MCSSQLISLNMLFLFSIWLLVFYTNYFIEVIDYNKDKLFHTEDFYVTSTYPINNSFNADQRTEIQIKFSDSLDFTTADSTTIIIYGEQSGIVPGTYTAINDSIISFDPHFIFHAGEKITVIISTKILSANGILLSDAYVLTFITSASSKKNLSFEESADFEFPNGVNDIVSADIDNDGDLDLISNNFVGSGQDFIAWNENIGDGNYSKFKVISENVSGPRGLSAADLDNDGFLDVISVSEYDDKIAWYKNKGDKTFNTQNVISTLSNGPIGLTVSELNGDGKLDIIVGSQYDDEVSWYENSGGAFLFQQVLSENLDAANSVYSADLDNDGDLDVISSSAADGKIIWFENLGIDSFGNEKIITENTVNAKGVLASDLDNDGDLDIISASAGDNKIAWYENVSGGVFSKQKIITTKIFAPSSIATADLDGDGDLDIIAASGSSQSGSLYGLYIISNIGEGFFDDPALTFENTHGFLKVKTADIDNDNDLDILATSWKESGVHILLNKGEVITSPELTYESIPEYRLHQNYPNPFNPSTTIRYDLPEVGNVNISVFDLTGRLVQTLQDGRKAAGSYTVNFDASGLASGVYFYQIRIGGFIETKRMMLIK